MRSFVMALAMMLCSCALAQQQAADDPLQGCYRLVYGAWQDGPPTPPRGLPPAEFRLLGELLPETGWRGGIARRILPGPSNRFMSAYWERVGDDSVAVMWTGWPDGMALQLRIAGDSLIGSVETWSDAIMIDEDGRQVTPHAEATTVRIPCTP